MISSCLYYSDQQGVYVNYLKDFLFLTAWPKFIAGLLFTCHTSAILNYYLPNQCYIKLQVHWIRGKAVLTLQLIGECQESLASGVGLILWVSGSNYYYFFNLKYGHCLDTATFLKSEKRTKVVLNLLSPGLIQKLQN